MSLISALGLTRRRSAADSSLGLSPVDHTRKISDAERASINSFT